MNDLGKIFTPLTPSLSTSFRGFQCVIHPVGPKFGSVVQGLGELVRRTKWVFWKTFYNCDWPGLYLGTESRLLGIQPVVGFPTGLDSQFVLMLLGILVSLSERTPKTYTLSLSQKSVITSVFVCVSVCVYVFSVFGTRILGTYSSSIPHPLSLFNIRRRLCLRRLSLSSS